MTLRRTQASSDELFKKTWSQIEEALVNVFDVLLGRTKAVSKENNQTKMQWYQLIYNAATQDQLVADKLYHKLREWLNDILKDRVAAPVIAQCKPGNEQELFRTVTRYYGQYRTFSTFGKIAFNYLGTYVTKRSGNDSVDMVFLKAFNQAVYNSVKDALRTVILGQVNARREGDTVDLSALKDAVDIFIRVGTATQSDEKGQLEVYSNDFEKAYLASLRSVYRTRTQAELSSEGGHFTYLKWVEDRQQLELFLAQNLLRASSYEEVRKATEQEMIDPHFATIINHPDSGCGVLLEDWKTADLARMYKLMKRVKDQAALKLMGSAMQARIVEEGRALIASFESEVSTGPLSLETPFVTKVMELNAKYGDLIKQQFEGSNLFHADRKLGFTAFLKAKITRKDPKPGAGEGAVETRETSFPEVLATYCDAVMKRELKDVVDPDLEMERLDELLTVFTYVTEKDVFQEYYKAKLSKRLLQTTPFEDLEKAFLERLQREMGKSYTHKLEGMLLDLESTKKSAQTFKTDVTSAGLGTDFDVKVLTEANWPAYKPDGMVPPAELRKCVDAFQRFFKKQNATKKLTWINLLGQATMSVSFPKGSKEVSASLYQASVLVTIDTMASATPNAVAAALGLDVKAVKPHIASMFLHKVYNVLRRVDANGETVTTTAKSFGDDDLFALNRDFTFKTRKFKLVAASASSKEGMPTESEIDGRRKIQVDAAVVRIMKSRKTLSYTELQDLVITQLSKQFMPQPKLIKLRVEDLITREYLRRHDGDQKMLDYLA
jgi:hypothetical protein